LRNIKIVLEYDGTKFSGWQVQPAERTVQGTLETAIERFLAKKIRVTGAGRTDTGVHALGQVANFHIDNNYDTKTIKDALNANLPEDVFIKEASEESHSFHSRFDALSRTYIYRISKKYSVFNRNFTWLYGSKLNIDRMNEGCKSLLGPNDFTSFTVVKSKKENMIMNIIRCMFNETEEEIVLTVESDRFLHKSVRAIMGTLILLGRSKLDVADIKKILLARNRKEAGRTVPAQGLFLKEVKY